MWNHSDFFYRTPKSSLWLVLVCLHFFDLTFTHSLYHGFFLLPFLVPNGWRWHLLILLTSGKYWSFWINANAAVLLYLAMALLDTLCGHHPAVLAGLAFLFSVGFILQILVILFLFLVISSRPKKLRIGSANCFVRFNNDLVKLAYVCGTPTSSRLFLLSIHQLYSGHLWATSNDITKDTTSVLLWVVSVHQIHRVNLCGRKRA